MAFTEREKAGILHHLGYPGFSAMAASVQLGFPSASQPLFLVYSSFDRILPESEQQVRRDLCECEAIENQLSDARKRLRASRIGEITLNGSELEQLRGELAFWQKRLADDLSVMPNPYAQMTYEGLGGGVGGRVVG